MTDIPISFDYKCQHYEGHFTEMLGATNWYLMINDRFKGQLIYSEHFGFKFHGNNGQFDELPELFVGYIMLWYE